MNDRNTLRKKKKANKTGFRKLFAKTKKVPRKQRAVTAAHGLEADSQKSGIAGMLIFLLVVHVVAIAACILHQKWTTNEVYNSPTPENFPHTRGVETEVKQTAVVLEEEDLFAEPEPAKVVEPANAGVIPSFVNEKETTAVEKKEVAVVAQPKAKVSVYTVQSGDTVQAIASRFGMTARDLTLLNNLKSSKIGVGKKLYIKTK